MPANQSAPLSPPPHGDEKRPSSSSSPSPPPPQFPTNSRPVDVRSPSPPPTTTTTATATVRESTPAPSPAPQSSDSTQESIPSPKAEREPTPEPSNAEKEDDDEADDEDIIDMETFGQLLELDEDEPEFSKDMAWAYFSQAEVTFKSLDDALSNNNLHELSSLGHYLKGSSAALGLTKVQKSCERIQHYGQRRDEEEDVDLSPAQALSLIDKTLTRVKREYAVAEKWLKNYYKESD